MKVHSKSKAKCLVGIALAACMCTATIAGGMLLPSTMSVNAEDSKVKKYYADFSTFEELEDAASDVAIQIASEGMTLLKNKDEALPLSSSESRVSVFGEYSDNIRQAGGGAGGGSSSRSKTLKQSMEAAGFTMNPMLVGYYAKSSASRETDPAGLDSVKASFSSYNDAAIIVISRSGSEMSDIKINNGITGYDQGDHSLMLDKNEKALINYVKESGQFGKIILLFNTPAPMEVANLNDDDEIDAMLWIGLTGAEGVMAVGKILNGEVNPSGRTVDIHTAAFDTDPTWFNVADASNVGATTMVMSPVASENKEDANGDLYYEVPGGKGFGNSGNLYASLDYEEGIYMGYRFYETAATETVDGKSVLEALATTAVSGANNAYGKTAITSEQLRATLPDGEDDLYYNRYNGVLYPFGYGLSYTTFDWQVEQPENTAITEANKNTDMQIKVTVTNNGSVAGKDVVQLYSNPQYYDGGIEKASANLVAFAKTRLLQPGESQTVTLSFSAFDLASFDDVDANGNGFAGYELEAGSYQLNVGYNSHEYKDSVTYTVAGDQSTVLKQAATKGANGIAWDKDPVTGNDIVALFSQENSFREDGKLVSQYSNTRREGNVMKDPNAALEFMTRADMVASFPDAPTDADRTFSADAIAFLNSQQDYYSFEDKTTDPWYKDAKAVEGWTQAASRAEDDKTKIQLLEMAGIDLDDEKWDEFMDQLTWDEMVNLVSNDGFKTPAIDAIGKPQETAADGASQLSSGTFWPNAILMGSTWNTELAELMGIMVGNESLFLDVQGWYGPSMNTHRSPFSGRNFEYYSQDGVHGGLMAAAVVKGARSKGVITYIKHCALNDQEEDRQTNGGLITWCSEQAMREIYLKPFEYAIKEGGSNAIMAAFNRFGMMPSVTSYDFFDNLVCDEWGFNGLTITDMYAGGNNYWPGNLMVRCGTGPLGSYSGRQVIDGKWDAEKNMVMVPASLEEDAELVASPTTWFAVRDMAKRILYMDLNSNLMANGNKIPLTEYFAEGTQEAVGGGWGTTPQPEIRKDITGLKQGTSVTELSIGLTEAQAEDIDGTVTYTITDGALPAGLKLNASTGAITGTPTESGEFKVTFTATVDNYLTVNKLVNIKVDGDGAAVEEDKTIVSVDEITEGNGGYKITFSDGTSITINNGADGQNGADGAPGKDGEAAKGGCSGSVVPTSITVGTAMLLAAGVYIAFRVRKNKNNK